MLPIFINYFLRRSRGYFRNNRAAKLTTAFLFILLVLSLAGGIFLFFFKGFRYLSMTAYFKDAIILYVYEIFMLVVFILVSASALITGLFSLFHGKDKLLLAVSPKYGAIPLLVLSRVFIASLWPLLIIVFPALLAISIVHSASFIGSLLTLFALAIFIAFAVVSALTLIFLVAWAIRLFGASFLRMGNLIAGTIIVSLVLILTTWHGIGNMHLNTLFQADTAQVTQPDISPIRERFAFLPSHPAALLLVATGNDDVAQILRNTLALAAMLCAVFIPFFLLKKRYLEFWQLFQENRTSRKSDGRRCFSGMIARSAGPLDAILRKEITMFFRNARGMMWFAFLSLIWILQSAAISILDHQLSERPHFIPFIVVALQIAVTIYFVDMFVLRFAFPSFSTEQKMGWILQAAPIDNGRIFLARTGFYVPLFVLLGLAFSTLGTLATGMSFSGNLIVLGTISIASATVTLYGLALGALFPNFETDDPEVLSTSFPGLTFIFTSVVYGAYAAYAVQYLFKSDRALPFAVFVALSLAISAFFALFPYRKLGRDARA